jgi:HlyD family secretion protein
MTKKIKIIIAVSAAVVLLIAYSIAKGRGSKDIKVAAETTLKRDITEEVTASGTIYPENEVKISPDVSGEIIDMYVQEGDTVKQGQLLVRINPDIYETQLEQAKAGLNTAKANTANVQAQLNRTRANAELQRKNFEMQKKLYDDKVISQQEYNTAEAQYLMSVAELKAAEKQSLASEFNTQSVEAGLSQAGKTYRRTTVIAPTSGVITGLVSKKGERVVGTAQMAGTEMMRISDLNRMEVRVDVNENDIVRIDVGDTANIEVDAYLGKTFKGIVTQVANSAKANLSTGTDQVTKYEVKILILPSSYAEVMAENNGKMPFRPGMSSTVHILTKTVKQVLAVPVASITLKDKDSAVDEKEEVVFVVNNNVVIKRAITTGIQDTRYIQILSGLKPGDVVVSAPYEAINLKLMDGQKVQVVDKESLFVPKE